MNLDELRSVRDDERDAASLQPLRPSFYAEAREFIAELKAERTALAEEADEPFADPEVTRLTDRLETAREVLEAIYDNRIGKIFRHASTAAAGDDVDPPPLTREEQALYQTLVESIEATKAAALEGEDLPEAVSVSPAEVSAAEDRDGEEATTEDTTDSSATDESDPPRVTVRITEEVGTILGVDEREYDLAVDDVVSLPRENATALIEREAAEPIEAE